MGFAVAWLCKDSDHNKLTHFKDKINFDRIEDLVNDDIGFGCYGFLQKQKRRMVCLEMLGKCQFCGRACMQSSHHRSIRITAANDSNSSSGLKCPVSGLGDQQ